MRIIILIVMVIMGCVSSTYATPIKLVNFHSCFKSASERFQIDNRLLIAIAEVESTMNPGAIGYNKRNGKIVSEDVGLMQINSSWFPKLESMGITRKDLLENPCQNIYVGAWILASNIAANGVNWESVGAYNAGFKNANAPFRMKYAKKVYARYLVLVGSNS
ncbi:hypothetical protein O185_01175 [Photorhabdus temperata J3]|uniref:Transglycosylase SLT domain-containing protein n=2 Tax=Photorhabdus temperata TaxID=574560 RepID=U7R506_PHOTE|nr:lytic transglycosylase domain-containing protein [Photorhabdus temperata]ERT14903.1 hypothetical protein O185_01175 [Photorhabdus temperata J3]